MSSLITYQYAKEVLPESDLRVTVNNEKQPIFKTPSTDIVAFSFSGKINIEIEYGSDVSNAVIRPVSKAIKFNACGNKISFSLENPVSLMIDVPGRRQLHIHANPISEAPKGDNLLVFKAGQVYDVGELKLTDGQTLFIEGGAVVRGCLLCEDSDNIKICGNGIFDGSLFSDSRRLFIFRRCRNVTIEDVILVNPRLWMVMLHACENVLIRGLKEVGEVVSSDGIDIVGSKDVVIDNCFLRNNDDCIAVKSFPFEDGKEYDVENIIVKNSVFMNDSSGNAIEIGHELRCRHVHNIKFENCDILTVHGYGAPFSIHNADYAVVENINYSDIRVEHYYDKLVDLRVINSMWGKYGGQGTVKNIYFENIHITASIYNPGYSISIIGGFDEKHRVENVCFNNFYINDKKVTCADELDLFVKDADNIRFN